MIRLLAIALIVGGIIFQPLATSMPMQMSHLDMSSPISCTHDRECHAEEHHIADASVLTLVSQHENIDSGGCDTCDMDCANGSCAVTCTASNSQAAQSSLVLSGSIEKVPEAPFSTEHVRKLIESIFRPPQELISLSASLCR